ncbi:alpha/beta fold hydrolase [Rhodococcus sp. HNM0569]|uniref:alpha/beta fold hydrolase n=1 Tax=Rhodococcus sp. HNM0569 TaxID=2716340 RepID=UPI003211D4BB
MSLVVRGAGAPVLALHGIGGSAQTCGTFAELLGAQGFRTYCWDAPGYGESEDPRGVVDHSVVVDEVLDELGVESAHLFGTSWGGVVAMQTALRSPHRVRSLVLADSTRGSGTSPGKAAAMRARVDELRQQGAPAFAAARAARLVSPDTAHAVVAGVEADMARVRIAGYAAAAECMASTDLGPELRHLSVPTLVVVGEDDVVTGVAESRLLADAIPGASFASIPHAGHAAVQERPDAMAAHVLRFLKGLQS